MYMFDCSFILVDADMSMPMLPPQKHKNHNAVEAEQVTMSLEEPFASHSGATRT